MTLSVIIATYRPAPLLLGCLRSLAMQDVLPDEVIIAADTVDQQDAILRYLAENPVPPLVPVVVASGKKGAAAARNAGASVATGSVLAFLDDDAEASRNWGYDILTAFNIPATKVAGGPVSPLFEGRPIPVHWWWIIGCLGVNGEKARPICCNMAIRKTVFEEMHGFDESLGRVGTTLAIGEETDLILRVQAKYPLYSVVMCPALVYHLTPAVRTSLPYMMNRAYYEGRGKAVIGRTQTLATEQAYLTHYLTHPDRYTIPVLLSVGAGYLRGMVGS